MSIDTASTYSEYLSCAEQLDEKDGNLAWKLQIESDLYDYKLIQTRLAQLRDLRKGEHVRQLLFLLRSTLSRNFGDMGNLELYRYTHSGTKLLIEVYIAEVLKCFQAVVDADNSVLPDTLKLETFVKLRRAFGRTALLLSGGATFGMNHVGVLKALFELSLLPRIISGSSAGAIIASVLCTKTDQEIPQTLVEFPYGDMNVFEDGQNPETILFRMGRFLKYGNWIDITYLNKVMQDLLGELTFAEAYNRTRRILNICVSSSGLYEMPRLLNYLTAPNVLVWSAVAASCSAPLLFSGQNLLVKDPLTGERQPWNPSPQSWIDGSVENDLPMARLSELFNVNHFIVSQVNPHVVPFLRTGSPRSGSIIHTASDLIIGEVMHGLNMLTEMNLFRTFFTHFKSVLSQKYSGDITILPEVNLVDFPKILANPTTEFLLAAILRGERATWPKLPVIQNHCAIELAIDNVIHELRSKVLFSDHIGGDGNSLDFSTITLKIPSQPSRKQAQRISSNLSVYKGPEFPRTRGSPSKSSDIGKGNISSSEPASPTKHRSMGPSDTSNKESRPRTLRSPRSSFYESRSSLTPDRSGTRTMILRRHQSMERLGRSKSIPV